MQIVFGCCCHKIAFYVCLCYNRVIREKANKKNGGLKNEH